MPKYRYHCHTCHRDFFVHHLMIETQTECVVCGITDISKLPTVPLHVQKRQQELKIGKITKKYIEDNKQLLDDMKKEVKKKAHAEEKK